MKARSFLTLVAVAGLAASSSQAATLAKVVAAGQTLRAGFYYSTYIDCSSKGNTTIRVTSGPSHGAVNMHKEKSFPNYPADDRFSVCNNRKVEGVAVRYRPEAGFVGDDYFSLDVIFPSGKEMTTDYQITVK